MRIAVISSGHIPSRWAHSITTVRMAEAFSELGHEVEILTVERLVERRNKDKIGNIHSYYGLEFEIPIHFFIDKSPYYLQEINKLVYKAIDLFDFATRGIIRRLVDPERDISAYCVAQGFDLCYARSYRSVVFNCRSGIPTIMESHTPRINADIQSVVKLSRSDSFKALVTISEYLKNIFSRHGIPKSKILVLETAVDLKDFQNIDKRSARLALNLPQNKYIVTYSGSLGQGRGIEYILNSAVDLPDVDFLIIGGHPREVKYWERKAKRMNNSKNVSFIGHVSNNCVPLYLIASDVLLMPYTTKTPTYKWMSPLKLFEYMAAGKPIIATNLPSIAKFLEDGINGVLIEQGMLRELSRYIAKVFSDKELAERLGENALKTAFQHTWTERAKKILEFVFSSDQGHA